MPDTMSPPPTAAPATNGAPRIARGDRPLANGTGPKSRLLAKLTSLTSVATVAAAGMIVVGVLAVVGGNYDKQVVHDQLAPQKIFFPPAGSPALLPGIKQYAGQQLLTGGQAKAYADKFINVHLSEVAGGKTYAQVSAAAIAAPKDQKLAAQKATLFQGETLRGLLLSAWGWSMIGSIATLAGIILIALGAVLFVLPLMNWRINLRHKSTAPAES
jgi:hypothetical protein